MVQNGIKFGMHSVSWRNDDLPELGSENTFEQCISEIALAGFEGTEIGGSFPKDKIILKKALKLRGLEISSAWFSTFFTTMPQEYTLSLFKEQISLLKFLDAGLVGLCEQGNSIQCKDVPIFGSKPYYTTEQWQKVISGFNKLAEVAEKEGIQCCVHHHMGTGIQTPEEIENFLYKTNPNVYLLFDTGHMMFSEGDARSVYSALEKYISRINYIHLKDIRNNILGQVKKNKLSFLEAVREGVFTVPGDGCLDFRIILKILMHHDYTGWALVEAEQDPAKANPFEYANKSYKYIQSIYNEFKSN